ncbi:Alpha-D-phosphohexomutase, alpha/beta/alpha domain I [Artemisia annua]|uniref:Alpha-D-phosphohexomutase, alpha/beta/alpha domain I n=1 Tax=Artemisia annua TaxID=35608 RepID=A0A2U1MBA0_ARTAN|nr:Alpha-D-phosphohexomutase, alpha/beta/alpha domain I [Artemisia annua]
MAPSEIKEREVYKTTEGYKPRVAITCSKLMRDEYQHKGRGKHRRFKRGYENVIHEAIRLYKQSNYLNYEFTIMLTGHPSHNFVGEESHLAIETSGHGATQEYHRLDDGAYLMAKLLNKFASVRASGQTGGSKVLTDLVEELHEPAMLCCF